jgi:3-hydroxyisobutyrate dehydrogenase-like beta-hydroxyacid dehydrogenase
MVVLRGSMTSQPSSNRDAIGFIGLGAIGSPIARRLIEAGFNLVVHDLRAEAMQPFSGRAQLARSSAEVGERAEVVFGCLPGAAAHREAILGAAGLIGANRVQLYVNLGTLGAPLLLELERGLLDAGVTTIDAPITGGVPRAESGTLTAIVSGDRSWFERVEPAMCSYANKRIWLGPQVGSAQVMKVVNNAISLSNLVIAAEAMLVGVRAGIDPRVMLEVINHGSGQNSATLSKIPGDVLTDRFNFGGSLSIVVKDLEAFVAQADSQGMPIQSVRSVLEAYQLAKRELGGAADVTEVVRPLERIAGVLLRDSATAK